MVSGNGKQLHNFNNEVTKEADITGEVVSALYLM
jgi:hypothetical protein